MKKDKGVKKFDIGWRLYSLIVFGVLLLVAGGIVAAVDGTQPRVMGHTLGEIEFPGCTNGQVLKYQGGTWVCANDINTNTWPPTVVDTNTWGPVAGGLYGYCITMGTGRLGMMVTSPATAVINCGCLPGYTKVMTGQSAPVVFWSCIKN